MGVGHPGGSVGRESAYSAGDPGWIPGLGRSPGEGNGYPPSILACRVPWTEEPGGLQSMRVEPLNSRGETCKPAVTRETPR